MEGGLLNCLVPICTYFKVLILNISSEVNPPELKFRERFHNDEEHENYFELVTDLCLLPQIHSYLLGLKSIKTLIVGLQKI